MPSSPAQPMPDKTFEHPASSIRRGVGDRVMTAPTHSTFGLLLTAVILSLFSIPILKNYPVMGLAIIGALLPDIDHPQSALGRLFFFISNPLNRRWRHRTITHSLAALGVLAVLSLPFGLIYSPLYPLAFCLGYFSHLMIDSMNKSGVPLFYPRLNPCVFPAADRLRITTGSWTGEGIILIALIFLLGLYVPISNLGVWRAIRYLTASQKSAYTDYKESKTKTLLDFKGKWRDSRKEVRGKAPILDATWDEFLILWDGRVIQYSENGQIIPDKSRVVVTEDPVDIKEISIQEKPFAYIKQLVNTKHPKSDIQNPTSLFVSGVLSSSEVFTTDLGLYDIGAFRPIEAAPKRLSLRFAQPDEIQSLEIQKLVDSEEIEKLETEVELLRLDIEELKAQFPSVRIEDLRGKIDLLSAKKEDLIAELQRMGDPIERMQQRDKISETGRQISAYEKELSSLILDRESQQRSLELRVREKEIRLDYKTKLLARMEDPQVLFTGKLTLRY